MTDRELMQEALYALTYVGDAKEIYSDTIESLRARLAQPEQEPVAWWHDMGDVVDLNVSGRGVPLYTAPPQQHSEQWWKHEVSNAWAQGYEKGRASVNQPEQEPVAWCYKTSTGDLFGFTTEILHDEEPASNLVPLYTAPPQREWVGLTDEEKLTIVRETDNPVDALAATEAKLKEKNHG